jgi:hypothetical protein
VEFRLVGLYDLNVEGAVHRVGPPIRASPEIAE